MTGCGMKAQSRQAGDALSYRNGSQYAKADSADYRSFR